MNKLSPGKGSILEKENAESVKRVLLTDRYAQYVSGLVNRLREDSCRLDTSKLVNEILDIFFKKHELSEYNNLRDKFFDKKNYLKKLINNASSDDVDQSIRDYLNQKVTRKKRGRKPKNDAVGANE